MIGIVDAELRCPVCHEHYREPAMLHCAHHVCLAHLGNVSNHDRIACPVCKEVTVVPEGGVITDRVLQLLVDRCAEASQRQNQAADSLAGVSIEALTCGFCEERLATKRCMQCVGVLCDECLQTSHSKGFFKSHTINDLEEASAGAGGTSDDWLECSWNMLCDSHVEEKLSFYCLDCRRPVCSHCLILGDHKGHQQTPIDQAFATGKETLGAWVDKLSHRIVSADELIEQLKCAEQEMERGAEAQRNVINSEMDHLRELIETKRHQLLSKSALEEKQKRMQLQAQVDRAEGTRQEAGALVRRSQGLLALSSEHAFLAVVLPLIQDMKKCAGQVIDTSPAVSCTYRPLSTDAQVRSLGDLDLGHPRHPMQQPQLQVAQQTPHVVLPVGGQSPIDATQHANYATAMQPGYGMPVATSSFLQPQQAAQPGPQVQYVYRAYP
mmetsp:Transcript_64494/g.179442  ORF Transcript_64494/g.179442 Transcript_64494/m.179442 type:complete len:438 (-) Transcript_64494:263-1576(-)